MILQGYTGSDIKEVCREAVVRVSHERAHQIESGIADLKNNSNSFNVTDFSFTLRPVQMSDFKSAMHKLTSSVDEVLIWMFF